MASIAKSPVVPGVSPVATGLVARVRQRLFPAVAATGLAVIKAAPSPRVISLNASIAEFLLVNRLKARSQRRVQAAEMLERAAHIVFVTCRNWFSAGDGKSSGGRTPL